MNSAMKFFYILTNSTTIYLQNCWVNITVTDHDLFAQVYCMKSTEHSLNTKTDFRMEVTYHTIIYQININKNYEPCMEVSSHFEYLENQLPGLDVTWQSVRGDLIAHP
jgi:hypothetical protein